MNSAAKAWKTTFSVICACHWGFVWPHEVVNDRSVVLRCDRLAFYREVEVMVGLRDPNIVQVLGVCVREDPVAVVVEYTDLGDLQQFLQTSAPDQLTAVIGSSFRTLRSVCYYRWLLSLYLVGAACTH